MPDDRREEFSGEFHDFIKKCLMREPAKRWSATALLEHPFVAHCADQLDIEEDLDQEGSVTARDELTDLADVVIEHHTEIAKRRIIEHPGKEYAPIPAPNETKLRSLARQLGLPFSRVVNVFTTKWKEMRSALEAFAIKMEDESLDYEGKS